MTQEMKRPAPGVDRDGAEVRQTQAKTPLRGRHPGGRSPPFFCLQSASPPNHSEQT
jgi:hypothetical protein